MAKKQTNKENQLERNREKYFESQAYGQDMSGKMPWCDYCRYCNEFKCTAYSQRFIDENTVCAKAYNRMMQNGSKLSKI